MNQLRLAQCLGTVSSPSFRRHHNENLINTLAHDKNTTFSYLKPDTSLHDANTSSSPSVAHQAGVNCLTIDHNEGRYLISGGADSSIRLWDLEQPLLSPSPIYTPATTLARGAPSSHTHALTSLSIYPFDPTPSTLISTSYDKTLKLTAITPSALSVVHTFDLDFIPYTHSLSPVPDSSPLIAVGTAHPAIRLLDLRSGLSTHSLSGPNGAIYTLSWSPRSSHILCSGSTDGKVLFFDAPTQPLPPSTSTTQSGWSARHRRLVSAPGRTICISTSTPLRTMEPSRPSSGRLAPTRSSQQAMTSVSACGMPRRDETISSTSAQGLEMSARAS